MSWYKKAQYTVEEYQATPLPAVPAKADAIKNSREIREPLPDTPEVPNFWDVIQKCPHYVITCSTCGSVFKCRCSAYVHSRHPPVETTVTLCPVCKNAK